MTDQLQTTKLIYAHDPMCSWCWGFHPSYKKLMANLPSGVEVLRVVGGLAPDSDEPMPESMKQYLSQTWKTIQDRIPGTEFNFDFWTQCEPRRSTYPACRAVVAARFQGVEWDEAMTEAIQRAYYLHAQNPSNNETLIEAAETIGLDRPKFEYDLVSNEVEEIFANDLGLCQQLGIQGFPSLVLLKGDQGYRIDVNPISADAMLSAIEKLLAEG